jgi:hypothetical protein
MKRGANPFLPMDQLLKVRAATCASALPTRWRPSVGAGDRTDANVDDLPLFQPPSHGVERHAHWL